MSIPRDTSSPSPIPSPRPHTRRARRSFVAVTAAAALCLSGVGLAAGGAASAAPPSVPAPGSAPAADRPQLEQLDRGLVAVTTGDGVFVSWRLLGHEVTGSSPTGMTGTDFAVYRDGELLETVTDSTSILDEGGTPTSSYRVVALVDGEEADAGTTVTPWAEGHYDLPLQRPAGGVTPVGETYTYAANDMSVGDVDGDGALEYVVKWDPSNAKDVSQVGYTGNVFVDTYEWDGTLKHRLDLGVNIRAGAHYTQFLVYDFDGDGKAEMMMKTAPGSKVTTYDESGAAASEAFVTMPQRDVDAGFSHDDDYRLSSDGYFEHLVEMFEGWSEHPEVVAGNWPATLEEAFGIEPEYDYPLSTVDATALADYFVDVYAPGRSARNVLRDFEGFILDGPEYLTVFDGETGAELQTVDYEPGRADDGLMWGDYAMSRIEPGNRVDRFLAGVAYLDGETPSAVFARGYYTRSAIVAYDWNGESISTRFTVDSGWTPMSNPFNDGPHGVEGTDPEFGTITTQGFHSLSAADVDGDGKHEIVYGSATIDDDGSLLYSSYDVMPEGSATPGATAKLGHGDAMHVTDIDPDREGLEIFSVHEGGTYAPYGYAMRDGATGEVLFGAYTGRDTGRGMIGDIDPATSGVEVWAAGTFTASGAPATPTTLGTNQSIRWAGDMTTQMVDGAGDLDTVIRDQSRGTVLEATGTRTNNGTKGNPSLVADILGDWREELLVRTTDSSAIRIFTSTEQTDRKIATLLHDVQYRAEVARQNTAYNQPSYPGFYLASDIDYADVPILTEEVSTEAVVFADEPGTDADTVTIPDVANVEYLIGGEVVAAGTYPGSGAVTVTARPLQFFFFAEGATESWTAEFSAVAPTVPGEGEEPGEGTTPGPGDDGTGGDGTGEDGAVEDAATAPAASDDLAFTGGNGFAGPLAAAIALLVLGLVAFIASRSRRAAREATR